MSSNIRNLTIEVKLSETELFRELLDILLYAFENAKPDVQDEIWRRINEALANTHDLREFEEKRVQR
jgi:hypothetical protein